MIISTFSGPSAAWTRNGFGDPLTQGQQFNCNSDICFGIGSFQVDFENFQRLLNLYATQAGFPTLTVDGFIGPETVAAARSAADLLLNPAINLPVVKTDLDVVGVIRSGSITKDQLTALIPDFTQALNTAAPAVIAMSVAAGGFQPAVVATGRVPGSSTSASVSIPAKAAAAVEAVKASIRTHSTIWLIAGALTAAATVGGAGYVVYRRRMR